MAYIINRFNGAQLTAVEDGTINTVTDLKFLGKNYSGYGEAQNENFLHLLESFSGTTAPTKPLSGQVWFDSGTNKLRFYTGAVWKNSGGTEVSVTAPSGLVEGDLWWNSTTSQLFGKTDDDDFVLIGPQSAGDGTTQMLSTVVKDNTNADRSVIIALINDVPLFVISNTEFTLNVTQPASVPNLPALGFSLIKKGTTLVNTNTNGVTASAGVVNEPVYWGTASDSLRLGGNLANQYRLKSDPINFTDAGFSVGDSNDLVVEIRTSDSVAVGGNTARISNKVGDRIIFGAAVSGGPTADNIVSVRNSSVDKGIFPELTGAYNIGSSTAKFAQMHADSFVGTATKATTLDVSGTGRNAATIATANTIAARDASGNLTAVEFNGTATKARYADLAEKYTVPEKYKIGTAVAVSGPNEITEVRPAKSSDIAIGVVSEKPAYLMNSELENGQAIALKGRVPVRVVEPVSKGQSVYAWENGVCTTTPTRALIGVALETNTDPAEKLVECVLKV
jgi:hypothetical protein